MRINLNRTLFLNNVSGGSDCGLDNYGIMRDTIGNFTCQLSSGLYVVEGECGTGGWALSTLISGKNNILQGDIVVDGQRADINQLKKFSCYVGEDGELKKIFGLKPMSVSEQINYGIAKGWSFAVKADEIKERFGLSDERYNRPFHRISGERWRASMAIGYAMGKFIYCFPWMNSILITQLENCLKKCLPNLLEIGAIIIIPTTRHEIVENITEKYEIIKLH